MQNVSNKIKPKSNRDKHETIRSKQKLIQELYKFYKKDFTTNYKFQLCFLKENHSLKKYQSKMRIFVVKKEKLIGKWRKNNFQS